MKEIKPLVTIITVTFNCVDDIENTVKSIISVKNKSPFEYIIVDGGSHDGTLDKIKKYEQDVDILISEPDTGIYNAMNKGWNLAKGSYILFVNAGDLLKQIPVDDLEKGIKKNADFVLGRVENNGNILIPSFNNSLKYRNTLPHQGAFYKQSLPIRYSESYKVFSDFDLNQKLYKLKSSFLFSNLIICNHSSNGISHDSRYFQEVYAIILSNFGTFFMIKAFLYHKISGMRLRIKRIFNV